LSCGKETELKQEGVSKNTPDPI